MESDIRSNPELFCRSCLCKTTDMRSLTSITNGEERSLLEMLIFIVNFDVKTNEKLPTQLCSECETILCKADAFKRRCIESETFLRDHVNIDDLTQIDVDIFTKTEVEDEIPVKKSKSNKGGVKKRSPKSEKSKKSKDLQLMDESTCKDEKDGIADILADNFDGKISDILDLKQTDMEVKTESFNDDIDMDFMDSDIDTPLISLKQENLSLEEVQLFSCSCGVHFNKEIEYKSHLDEKKCEGYTKSTKITLEKLNPNGGRNISIKRSIVCPECNLEFKTVKACKVHRRIHKNGDETGRFACNKCMRKFNRKSSYTTHINHHEVKANLKFTCDTCKREFQHRAHLDNHILALHTRDKGYICEVCSNSFSTQESLETHKESHKMEKKHQCNLCKKAFYMLSTLNDHMRTHTGEKPFLCSVCGKGFSQKTNLAQHVRRHQGLKPFKCEDCDKKFVSKGELVAHNRKHSGAHPFICDECGAGFTTSSSLVKHRRIHTGERPYACDLCPMRFAASGTLKNHRRTHTGEKPFQCSYCEKAFVQRHDLISHIRCHTGERPFACECGLAFRKVASLRHHAKTHARDPPHALLDERMKMGID